MNSCCWEWTGCLLSTGYGKYALKRTVNNPRPSEGGVSHKAHRYSYELEYGEFGGSEVIVRHKCDNPLCVRPSHLLLGTMKDNTQDMLSRQRHAFGKDHKHAVLTDELVAQMRTMFWEGRKNKNSRLAPHTMDDVMARFGQTRGAAYAAVHCRTWRHVAHLLDYKGDPAAVAVHRKRPNAKRIKRRAEHNLAKLTEQDVAEIKAHLKAHPERGQARLLARKYGVNETTISSIKLGKIWADDAPKVFKLVKKAK